MQQGLNIDAIKQYNASLRDYKDKSSKLRAELEFNEQELNRQCAELSAELGVQVTPDNIRDILAERIAKINNTMAVGNEILSRIRAEEAAVVANANANEVLGSTTTQVNNTQSSTGGVPMAPSIESPTTINNAVMGDLMSDLPPIFANRQGSIVI